MGWFNRKKNNERLCPNCRKPVGTDIVFCESCGLRLLPPPACVKCRLPLAPETNFCEACGTPVSGVPVPHECSSDRNEQPEAPQKKVPEKKGKASRGHKARKKDRHQASDAGKGAGVQDLPGTPGTPVQEHLPVPADPAAVPDNDRNGPVLPIEKARPIPAGQPGRAGSPAFMLRVNPAKRRAVMTIIAVGLLCAIVIIAGQSTFRPMKTAVIATGNANPSDDVPASVAPGPDHENTTAGASGLLQEVVPGPTEVPPDRLRIWLQAEREPITHEVSVLYDGGKGQYAVRDVLVRLTRSDGQVLTELFRPLVVGEGVTLQGTEYSDHLEVVVTYSTGEEYTVIDKVFEYKKRN